MHVGYPELMRLTVLAIVGAAAAGVAGFALVNAHWSFVWPALIAIGVVLLVGTVATALAMLWPERHQEPQGSPVGF